MSSLTAPAAKSQRDGYFQRKLIVNVSCTLPTIMVLLLLVHAYVLPRTAVILFNVPSTENHDSTIRKSLAPCP